MSLTPKELLNREVQILKQIPKSEVPDFIERKGGELRSILTDHEEMTNREILEALKLGYSEYT